MEGGGPRDGGREHQSQISGYCPLTVLLVAPALWVDLNEGIRSKEGLTEASKGNPSDTDRTWFLPVWLFPSVCPQMSCEIRRSGEDLATVPEEEGREVGGALGWSTLPSRAQLKGLILGSHQHLLFALSPDISKSTEQRDRYHTLSLGTIVVEISKAA